MFEDLRGFLAHLESQKQLLRVKDEVTVKYEIAAGMRKTSDIEGPALLFENAEFPMSMFIVAVSRASVRIAN